MNINGTMYAEDIYPGYCAVNQWSGTSEPCTFCDTAVNLGLNLVTLPRQPQHRGRLQHCSSQEDSALTGQERERKKKKEWQAKPIKHEVECEGMYPPLFHKHLRNVHRILFVLSMCPFILHWSTSLIGLFISTHCKQPWSVLRGSLNIRNEL